MESALGKVHKPHFNGRCRGLGRYCASKTSSLRIILRTGPCFYRSAKFKRNFCNGPCKLDMFIPPCRFSLNGDGTNPGTKLERFSARRIASLEAELTNLYLPHVNLSLTTGHSPPGLQEWRILDTIDAEQLLKRATHLPHIAETQEACSDQIAIHY